MLKAIIDDNKLTAALIKVAAVADFRKGAGREFANEAALAISAEILRNFDTQGERFDAPWAPPATPTKLMRRKRGKKYQSWNDATMDSQPQSLQDTGELMKSFQVGEKHNIFTITKLRIEFGSDDPVARPNQDGAPFTYKWNAGSSQRGGPDFVLSEERLRKNTTAKTFKRIKKRLMRLHGQKRFRRERLMVKAIDPMRKAIYKLAKVYLRAD